MASLHSWTKNSSPPPGTDELKVLYYKMKSNYYRYLAEYATDDAKGKATESACVAHVETNKIAENDLAVTHPIHLAMALNSSVFQADVFENTDEACEMTRVAFDDAITAPVIDIPAVTQQTLDVPMSEMVKQLVEVPKTPEIQDRIQQRTVEQIVDVQVQQVEEDLEADTAKHPSVLETAVSRSGLDGEVSSRDRNSQNTTEQIVDDPVEQVVQIPQVHVVEKTVEIPQLDVIEKIIETSKTFSQNRVQQRFGKQTIEPPAISLAERVVEAPDTQTQDKTQHVVNTHVQHVVNTVEVERPKLAKETVQEKINQVSKHIKIPQVQFLNKVDDMLVDVQQQIHPIAQTVQKTTEIPQLQFPDQVVDVPVVVQRQVPSIETVEKTVEVPQTQSIVKELRSKFEVGHTNKVHARNQPDKNRAIRNAHKTVEVPRVQYIDKVTDIPLDMQRQVSTTQAAQDIEEVEDVSALTQSEVPNIADDDEDWLEQESKKRKLPMPAETVFESRADESDFDRFEDLVLPSHEGKTLFVSIASGDEAEDESESLGCQMVQVVHADWAQELREERKKFTDDVASDMSDVKNELAHVRELLGVLVRRERRAETKTEIAARRLDRMEREQHEADDAEHEASLEEALSNQSKAVKVLVDKWFVDKGYGFGKAPTGEIIFIHASTVQGAEVLTIGTDAWVQVVNDDARAQGGYRAKRAWGRNAWKAERDKENANKVAQKVRRAAALTAKLAAQSEKKTATVCDQPTGLDELAGHIEAPNMGAGGSHPQATMMPDPWATYERPSAEALDFYEKANGRDRTQERQELENMRPGELRRSLERWQAHGKEVQRLQEKKEHAWDLYSRVPSFGHKKKENFEKDFGHKVVYDGKVDEKRLREWTDEMQSKVQKAEHELEARERKWMESEDSNSQRRQAWGETLATRNLLLVVILFFASAMTARRSLSQFSQRAT